MTCAHWPGLGAPAPPSFQGYLSQPAFATAWNQVASELELQNATQEQIADAQSALAAAWEQLTRLGPTGWNLVNATRLSLNSPANLAPTKFNWTLIAIAGVVGALFLAWLSDKALDRVFSSAVARVRR